MALSLSALNDSLKSVLVKARASHAIRNIHELRSGIKEEKRTRKNKVTWRSDVWLSYNQSVIEPTNFQLRLVEDKRPVYTCRVLSIYNTSMSKRKKKWKKKTNTDLTHQSYTNVLKRWMIELSHCTGRLPLVVQCWENLKAWSTLQLLPNSGNVQQNCQLMSLINCIF